MNNKKLSDNNIKAVCSVTSLCKDLSLSRAQFYNLQAIGIFPKSLKDKRTGRPYFDIKLQEICQEVRRTGIGHNGQPYLFYSPRSQPGKPRSTGSNHVDSKHKEFVSTLNQMGLAVNTEQVSIVLKELYPDGSNGIDEGIVVRELFRRFKEK